MTWSNIKSVGSGDLRFKLVIEGWPDAWVSDVSITHSIDSETVRVGLSAEGIVIQDRVIMHEARVEQSGITFRIKPTAYRQQGVSQWDDQPTASFTRRALPLAMATASLTVGGLSMPAISGGGSLSNSTVYYMGSEAISVGTWPTISARGHFNSIDQTHFVPDPNAPTDAPLYIWDYPPTMEGRRVSLYVWGGGDLGSAAGTRIWRGIVRRPPVLSADGVTWQIQCSGIVDVLKQRLAGDIKSSKVVGIHHHSNCAIKVQVHYDGDWTDPADTTVVGWDADERAMMDRINTAIDDALTALGADTFIDHAEMTRTIDGPFRIEIRTTATGQAPFALAVSSPIIGGVATLGAAGTDYWTNAANGDQEDGFGTNLPTSSTLWVEFKRPHPGLFHPRISGTWEPSEPIDAVAPLGNAFEIMVPPPRGANARTRGEYWQSDNTNDRTNFPPWRVYVEDDFDGVEAVYIPGTDKPGGVFALTNTGSNSYGFFIDVEPWTLVGGGLVHAVNGHPARGFMGFLDGSTEIRARRNYGTGVTVFDFVTQLHSLAAAFGNRADTPFVTGEDMTSWAAANGGLGSAALLSLRDYIFFGPVPLDAMLQEELKLINYFMRINSSGLIDAVPMPALTPTTPVSGAHVIASGDIITPADNYGAWPTWEPMRDGRITTVKYQTVYDAIEEDWIDPPMVFMDAMAISLSKTRGKAVSEIKPYSSPSPFVPFGLGGFGLPGVIIQGTGIKEMALRHLAMWARDYDVVTICVPFTKFDVLCGDIVTVTHPHIPDGLGKRGISAVRGVVLERSWPMDPQSDGYGKLTIMLVQEGVSGYAPSGIITAQTNTAGNVWNLTLSTALPTNELLSTNGDGLVLEHFASGDYIRLVEINDFSPTIVTGTISSIVASAGTCTVSLDGAWTPGAVAWALEFREGEPTTSQARFAYVADSNLQLSDGSFARRFS